MASAALPLTAPPYAVSAEGITIGGKRVAMSYDTVGGFPIFPEFEWLGYAPLPRGRHRVGSLGVRASLAVPAGTPFPDAAAAATVRLAHRLLSRVDFPAGPQPANAVSDAMLAIRQAHPSALPPTPEGLQTFAERGRLVTESLAAARTLTLVDMDRTARAYSALGSLAVALHRPTVPIDQATETAQRALQDLLRAGSA
jgi:hypothetical protein